jgi:hypothetical protein
LSLLLAMNHRKKHIVKYSSFLTICIESARKPVYTLVHSRLHNAKFEYSRKS